MEPSVGDLKMLAELNAVHVKPRDVVRLVKAVTKRHVKGGDNTELAQITSVIIFQNRPDVGRAVYFRLEALARLMDQHGLKGWTMKGDEDAAEFVNGVVFTAVAQEPLVIIDGKIAFERESFLKRILKLAEPEGMA